MPTTNQPGQDQLPAERADRRIAAAFAWGMVSRLLAGPMYLGSLVPGYLVGRTGLGKPALASVCGGFLVGITATMVFMISSMVSSGCPSCIDASIVAPFAVVLFIPPLAIGFWLGQRGHRRSAERILATG